MKTDLITPSTVAPSWQTPTFPRKPAPAGAAKAVGPPLTGGAAAGAPSKVDGGGGGGGAGDGKQTRGEGEGDLNDVNWSDDEALDALVDKLAGEVGGKKNRRRRRRTL